MQQSAFVQPRQGSLRCPMAKGTRLTPTSNNASPVMIAPTAIIEADVNFGSGVKVWHYVQIRTGATIGDDVIIGKGCFIDEHVDIGQRTKIQNGSQIYAPAVIGKGVFIGPLV